MTKPILEVAELQVPLDVAADFEDAVRQAEPIFRAAPGCLSFLLRRSIEHPSHYQLVVGWTSIHAHMVDFRSSKGFEEWRRLVGHFFTDAPRVQHFKEVIANG